MFCLTSVCLMSVAYIGPKSRTSRKTKIGTEVAHVTCDSDTTFKVKRSKVKVTRPVYSPRRLRTGSGQRGNALSVGNCCYVAVCRRGGRLGGARRYAAHRGGEGRGHIVSPRAQLVLLLTLNAAVHCACQRRVRRSENNALPFRTSSGSVWPSTLTFLPENAITCARGGYFL